MEIEQNLEVIVIFSSQEQLKNHKCINSLSLKLDSQVDALMLRKNNVLILHNGQKSLFQHPFAMGS